MKVDEVVNAVGAMSAKERGFDSHKEHSAQANKQKSSKKQEGSTGKGVVRERFTSNKVTLVTWGWVGPPMWPRVTKVTFRGVGGWSELCFLR